MLLPTVIKLLANFWLNQKFVCYWKGPLIIGKSKSPFYTRCREKDEEIEDLHKKVIALQVKIKDFVQQNSQAEEQVRNIKEKYATELNEKEKISHALSSSETKCRTLEEEVDSLKSSTAQWEKKVSEMKTNMESLESENEEANETITKLTEEIKKNKEEEEQLQKQVCFAIKWCYDVSV